MNTFKFTSKVKMAALMLCIAFVVYNVVLFVLCGFTDHGGPFWISYAFMLVAFCSLTVSGYLLHKCDIQPKDWLFGYPVLRHCTIYIVLELFCSILFMVLDAVACPWGIAFAVQFVLLAVHLVFLISCFLAKETIDDVQTKVQDSTSYIRLLQADVEMVAEKATDVSVKEAFTKLAEQVRYSDPMRNADLLALEQQISQQVSNADSCLTLNDSDGALQCCNRATLLLIERNKKCKAMK